MRLNQATDYAFRMVLYMSILPVGTKITGAELAKNLNIPDRFLLKIMRMLTGAKIMKSYRGVDGGFSLQQNPEDITLLDVIKAVEGSAYIHKCLYDPESCTRGCHGICSVRHALESVQEQVASELADVNFATLAKNEKELRRVK